MDKELFMMFAISQVYSSNFTTPPRLSLNIAPELHTSSYILPETSVRIGTDCALSCLNERKGAEKHVDMEDDSGDEAAQGDYDYYRRYGDVPSPGIGH
ncbi:hypothetical protein GH714_037901 [Hevea brasiliensis]|uniref:Uncharacterized protein n=1 Tax=Hevea brasiliensis TaxID=3981 RepID=A0A6A6L9W4_HEVBR|nr:hypothetical protein GH714_037901 [Hevea brasiliensis]